MIDEDFAASLAGSGEISEADDGSAFLQVSGRTEAQFSKRRGPRRQGCLGPEQAASDVDPDALDDNHSSGAETTSLGDALREHDLLRLAGKDEGARRRPGPSRPRKKLNVASQSGHGPGSRFEVLDAIRRTVGRAQHHAEQGRQAGKDQRADCKGREGFDDKESRLAAARRDYRDRG